MRLPDPPRPEDFFPPEAPRPAGAAPVRKEQDPYTRDMMRVAGMVTEFSASILGCIGLGWLIDRWVMTGTRWTLILGIVGIVGAGYNFVRRAMALNRGQSGKKQ